MENRIFSIFDAIFQELALVEKVRKKGGEKFENFSGVVLENRNDPKRSAHIGANVPPEVENPVRAGKNEGKSGRIHRIRHKFRPQSREAKSGNLTGVFPVYPKIIRSFSTVYQQVWKRMWKKPRKEVEKIRLLSLTGIIEDSVADRADCDGAVTGHEKDQPASRFFCDFCECFHKILLLRHHN